MKEYNIRFFLKFGKREHIEAFQKKGQIYMNTLNYFRNLPEENLVGDKFEGITYLKPLGKSDFLIEIPSESGRIRWRGKAWIHPTDKIEGNLFCLYGGDEQMLKQKHKGELNFLLLREAFEGSGHMAIIHNPKEFMKRVETYLSTAGFYYKYQPVEYINFNNYEGRLNQFCKRLKYKPQNEYRIFVATDINRPLCFEIGDISDICKIASAEPNFDLPYSFGSSEQELDKTKKLLNSYRSQ